MRPLPILIAIAVLAPAWVVAQTPPATTPPAAQAPAPPDTMPRDEKLPPSEMRAKAQLETSPRHGEMIDVKWAEGKPPLRTWIVYPERKDKAGVVLIIHEIYGLSDWIRGVADQVAREGFIAVAPDLISGLGPGGGGTDSVASRDDVVKLVRGLTPEDAQQRLDAVRAWATRLPAANGKIATMGFCWGGARSFAYAASTPPPAAAVVYYGTSPDSVAILAVKAPVQGHYGADDARVNATIEPAKLAMARLKRSYDPNIYEGAGHGFLRGQTLRDGANRKATQEAWPRTLAFLRKHLE
ncbi:MAG TPA: dienelactone hydrolase family protein [Candidatus Eisenbacteria bacterium]|nr:dienelactone hydrolase family protein [Candidatus Eisenbacteria bacterium]